MSEEGDSFFCSYDFDVGMGILQRSPNRLELGGFYPYTCITLPRFQVCVWFGLNCKLQITPLKGWVKIQFNTLTFNRFNSVL